MSQRNVDVIQAIKAQISIVDIVKRYADLRRNGPRWVAPCPFHQETKPSFSVNEEDGWFYCFGCQASGDLFDFYGQINGLDFRESLEQLAEEAGIVLDRFADKKGTKQQGPSKRKQLLGIQALAAAHFAENLQGASGKECREYVKERGLSDEIIKEFGIGWAQREWQALANTLKRAGFSDALGIDAAVIGKGQQGRAYDRFRGRLMFPIKALSGSVIAFGGRIIADEDEAKYINTSDSLLYKKGDHLYGLPQARKAITTGQPALLTEGYMDVVTLHQFGIASAVGVLGTALTPEQVKRISGFTSRVELLFDGDAPGRKAALRACEMMLVRGLSCKVVLFPEGEDVDSLLRAQGVVAFEALRARAPSGMDFCIQTLRAMAPCDAIVWARDFLRQVQLPELVGRFASELARGLGLVEADLRESVAARRSNSVANEVTQGMAQQNRQGGIGRIHKLEQKILHFLVRYPAAGKRLEVLGVGLILQNPFASAFWGKVQEHGDKQGFFDTLDEQERLFCAQCRQNDLAPLTNEDAEYAELETSIRVFQKKAQTASMSVALRSSADADDFSTELALLRALQETVEMKHGEY